MPATATRTANESRCLDDQELDEVLTEVIKRFLSEGRYPSKTKILMEAGLYEQSKRGRLRIDAILNGIDLPENITNSRKMYSWRRRKAGPSRSCKQKGKPAISGISCEKLITRRLQVLIDYRYWYGRPLEPDETIEIMDLFDKAYPEA